MSASVITSLVFGAIAAALSISAVLVGLGRVLSSIDALREESRKRADEHAAELKALRHDVVEATRQVSIAETRADAMEHRLTSLESEVRAVRDRLHTLSNAIHPSSKRGEHMP